MAQVHVQICQAGLRTGRLQFSSRERVLMRKGTLSLDYCFFFLEPLDRETQPFNI